jgi:hypothetical protein
VARVAGPSGPIPVVGVSSASAGRGTPRRRARYHLVEVRERGGRFRIALRSRGFDPKSGAFRAEGDPLDLAGG